MLQAAKHTLHVRLCSGTRWPLREAEGQTWETHVLRQLQHMLQTSIHVVERLSCRQATSPKMRFAAPGRGSLRVPLSNRQS